MSKNSKKSKGQIIRDNTRANMKIPTLIQRPPNIIIKKPTLQQKGENVIN